MAAIEPYVIIPPAIPSGSTFLFETDSGVEYEVRFGRKQNNILAASIVFGVLNEEFESDDAGEYVVVNRGEIYRVMATIAAVIKMYLKEHPRMMSYEFTGENRLNEGDGQTMATARTKFFLRYINLIFGPGWKPTLEGNTVTVLRQ
ncbi:MAG: hypothetical protein JKY52_05270 [Flavobacteriales bacterium]|nr:hypothetical protein [Flavobacteriales bacterium]